jgi:mRNA interferase YafQ
VTSTREIEYSNAFKRDFKRVKTMPRHRHDSEPLLVAALDLISVDTPLPGKYRDHALIGEWSGYRECHLKPDLLLIYSKPDPRTLRLARLGSHAELFKK